MSREAHVRFCERLEVKSLRPTHPYIPMRRGFLYLVAVMDWATRKVLSWRVSNTMDVDFCLAALDAAIERFGVPEIFNSDQGSQFTTPRFTGVLKGAGIRISMDGRGRWLDNVFIERLWRSLKYECVYLHVFETGSELRAGVTKWIDLYNGRSPHSALAGRTPNEAYGSAQSLPGPGHTVSGALPPLVRQRFRMDGQAANSTASARRCVFAASR